jgi:beta-lactamase regulating signal transducer with metallopeptidase domain
MKVSIVLLLGLAVAASLRTRSAALRHWVVAVAMAAAALTPMLAPVLPAWTLPLRPPSVPQLGAGHSEAVVVSYVRENRPDIRGSLRTARARPAQWAGTARWLAGIWIAGVGICLGLLAVGLARLSWLASRAQPPAARWLELAAQIAAEYDFRRPVRLFQSSHPSLLATWGWRRPAIILPAAAARWSDDVARVVLCHELAHIRRADWLAQMIGELLRAAYWFNPLVWIACARLRLESERACDDEVLNRGVEGSVYATHLVALARDLGGRRAWVPAPAMARPSTLHRRVTAMLNDRLDRTPIAPQARFATVILILIATAAIGAAQAFSTFSGSLVDPQGGVLPGASVTLSNAQRQTKYEVETTRTGEFEIPGLPPGDYAIEIRLPGFQSYRATVTMQGASVRRDLTLQIGTLQESITVADAPVEADVPARAVAPRPNPPCGAQPETGQVRIGGNIRPPWKIKDVRPTYPAALRGTGAQGEVILDAVIGVDGFVKDVQPRDGANPAFAEALITAVRQWQFDSTLLNCVPVEPVITITGTFLPQR